MIRFLLFYKSFLPDVESCLLIVIFIIKDEAGFLESPTSSNDSTSVMDLFYTSTAVAIRNILRQNKVKRRNAKSGEPALILGAFFLRQKDTRANFYAFLHVWYGVKLGQNFRAFRQTPTDLKILGWEYL